jgi:hypothetical protein
MNEVNTFGRRADADPAPSAWTPPPPAAASDLPSLKDLGFTPGGDAEELRAFKQGYRKRRFLSLGGWRWVGGLCFLVSTITGFLDLHTLSVVFGTAGALAIAYSIFKPFLPDSAP